MIACLVHIRLDSEGEFQSRTVLKAKTVEEFQRNWESIRKEPGSQFFVYTTKPHPPTEDFLGTDRQYLKQMKDFVEWNLAGTKSAHLWCPYCKEGRDFSYISYQETHCCDACRVSTNDYHVRRYNGVD
jgi:hypothetical protein